MAKGSYRQGTVVWALRGRSATDVPIRCEVVHFEDRLNIILNPVGSDELFSATWKDVARTKRRLLNVIPKEAVVAVDPGWIDE